MRADAPSRKSAAGCGAWLSTRAGGVEADVSAVLLAIGVLSPPANRNRRQWLRRGLAAVPAHAREQVLVRFVMGTSLPPEQAERSACDAKAEAKEQPDLLLIQAPDATIRSCVDKSFGWYVLALRLYPNAAFIAKTDDDSFVNFGVLLPILRSVSDGLPSPPLLYAGWPQYSSYLPEFNLPCGWAVSTRGALHNARPNGSSNCARCINHRFCYVKGVSTEAPMHTPIVGPFPFATGALQIFSAALARRVFGAGWTTAYVAEQTRARGGGRTAGRGPRWAAWSCQFEDTFVGLAVSQTSSEASVAFVSLGSLVMDAEEAHARVLRGSLPSLDALVTVHKLEVDQAKLDAAAEREQRHNLWHNTTVDVHRRRADTMRWVEPRLRRVGGPPAQRPPRFRCVTREAGERLNRALAAFFALPCCGGWTFCEPER